MLSRVGQGAAPARDIPIDELPTAIWSGTITVLGVALRAYVLDDGTRIIDAADINALFAAMKTAPLAPTDPSDFAALGQFCRGRGKPA